MNSLSQTSSLGTLTKLWIGILAGPLAWAFDEVIGYTATSHECSTGSIRLLHGLTIATLIACLAGVVSARAGWQNLPDTPNGSNERTRAMAIAGTALSIAFALVIIATEIPRWMLSPCN